MWRSMLKVAAATTMFALLHSALASRAAKEVAARIVGVRNRNGLYRVFYLAQSAATCGALVAYIRHQPSGELYRIERPLATMLNAVQAGALLYAITAAAQVGIRRMAGVESFLAWLGKGPVPAEPEAQGPALDREGKDRGAGPFAWSRHPLNFAPLPILWLSPRMTTSLLAFNIAATTYLILGSVHEESRLREAFGDDYDAYVDSGVSFYLPSPSPSEDQPISPVSVG